MTTEMKNIPEFFRQFENGLTGKALYEKRKSRKGIPINLSPSELRERAKKSAITRAKNRAKEFEIRGETLKILLLLDENLLKDFDKARIIAHDRTLTAGIRRAMQDFIDKYKSSFQAYPNL